MLPFAFDTVFPLIALLLFTHSPTLISSVTFRTIPLTSSNFKPLRVVSRFNDGKKSEEVKLSEMVVVIILMYE